MFFKIFYLWNSSILPIGFLIEIHLNNVYHRINLTTCFICIHHTFYYFLLCLLYLLMFLFLFKVKLYVLFLFFNLQ